ncbi:MAG: hypothetical protein GTO22_23800, partial [Gemmatimonadales bacterium]|nr:hypothetical protein [Gemmatimonadales bacterium]
DVLVTLRKTLHNNGPYDPVRVSVDASAVAPPGCTATRVAPDGGDLSVVDSLLRLPLSQSILVEEVWEVHCSGPSTHIFAFGNEVKIADEHVEDPDPSNNSRTTTWEVDVIAQADLKILSQGVVDGPSEIAVSEDVPVTLRKTLHNNGPYGPVSVSINARALTSPDCRAT